MKRSFNILLACLICSAVFLSLPSHAQLNQAGIANRAVEVCDDGIDNDGDGFIDCSDSDCDVLTNCPIPANCTAPEGDIIFESFGAVRDAAYTTLYILTDPNNIIQQVNDTTEFTAVTNGGYIIYELNYQTARGISGVTPGLPISGIYGGCFLVSGGTPIRICGGPDAIDDYDTTTIHTPVTVYVTLNDTDPEGDINPASVDTIPGSGPSNGTVQLNGDGSITYTPNAGFAGDDQFGYTVCDSTTPTPLCDVATVFIHVGFGGIDMGDAPDSYATDLFNGGEGIGPSHNIVSFLSLGNIVDNDADGVPGNMANDDDRNNVDDEDALATEIPSLLENASVYKMNGIRVVNPTAGNAFVSGWIDFNCSGTFEPGEWATVSVGPGVSETNLFWSGFTLGSCDTTYVRLRISTNQAAVSQPFGSAPDGEVEDHLILINRSSMLCGESDPSPAIVIRNQTDVYRFDVVTGASELLRANAAEGLITPGLSENIDAIGFNSQDGMVWGSIHGTKLARIDGTGRIEVIQVDGLPGINFQAGDIDNAGRLFLYANGTSSIYVVDVNPHSETYLELVLVIPTAQMNINDWAYSSGNNMLYGIDNGFQRDLWRIDASTGAVTSMGTVTAYGFDNYTGDVQLNKIESVFIDVQNHIYATVNNGKTYRVLNVNAAAGANIPAQLFSTGPAAAMSDAAHCALSAWYMDMGDNPDDYSTSLGATGPRHALRNFDPVTKKSNLMIGSFVDNDLDGFANGEDFSASANDDDNEGDGANDEDGLVSFAYVTTVGDVFQMNLNVTNHSGSSAFLYAWIDLNNNQLFETTESIMVTVPSSGTDAEPVSLSWDLSQFGCNVDLIPGNATFARFRLTTDALSDSAASPIDERSYLPAYDGEVEDHRLIVLGADMGDLPGNYPQATAIVVPDTTLNKIWLGIQKPGLECNPSYSEDALADGDEEDGLEYPEPANRNYLYPGQTYPFKATVNSNESNKEVFFGMWFDWDNDGTFNSALDEFYSGSAVTSSPATATVWVTIPMGADPAYKIRLIASEVPLTAGDYARTVFNSEIEDYTNPPTLLPVELTYFEVEKQGDDAILTWQTASEVNNDYFSVQRSVDALNWEEIGIVEGHGNSTQVHDYSYVDLNLAAGKYYYRLQQYDFDGSYEYTDIKWIEIKAGGNTVVNPVSYYPIPTHVHGTLTFEGLTTDRMEISLHALNGSMAVKTTIIGTTMFDLSPYNLDAGMYIMDVIQADVIYGLKLILFE